MNRTPLAPSKPGDPDVISRHLRWRDAALDQAIPVSDYLALAQRRQP